MSQTQTQTQTAVQPTEQPTTHTVKAGETLNSISQQYGFNDYQSAGATGYKSGNPNLIFPGEQIVISSKQPRKEFVQNSSDLNNQINGVTPATNQLQNQTGQNVQQQQADQKAKANDSKNINIDNYNDAYTQQLDKLQANSDKATSNLIENIKAKRQANSNEVNASYDRYQSGLQLLGIQSENIQYSPDIVMGNIQQAENARLSKLQELDRAESTAILEAQMARDENDFRLLKDRMNYIKEIKKERLNTLKDSFDMMKAEQGIAEIQASRIYDEVQKLGSDQAKVQFMNSIAAQLGIDPSAIVSSVAEIKRARDKEAAAAASKLKSSSSKGGSSGKLTEGDKDRQAWSNIVGVLNSDTMTSSGAPVLDQNGYLTKAGWVDLQKYAATQNISRLELLKEISNYIYLDDAETIKSYGLTENEYKAIKGASSDE